MKIQITNSKFMNVKDIVSHEITKTKKEGRHPDENMEILLTIKDKKGSTYAIYNHFLIQEFIKKMISLY